MFISIFIGPILRYISYSTYGTFSNKSKAWFNEEIFLDIILNYVLYPPHADWLYQSFVIERGISALLQVYRYL